ncbi:MAG: DUF4440 domain-containing protein [Candidatus Zixiibacteriota bacterium]
MKADDTVREQLYNLELRLQRLEVRSSPEQLRGLLADEFVEIGGSGRVYDRDAIIAALFEETCIRITMTDFNAVVITADTVLVTYRAAISEGDRVKMHKSWRSSLWRNRDSRWQMVFHQGTPIIDADK